MWWSEKGDGKVFMKFGHPHLYGYYQILDIVLSLTGCHIIMKNVRSQLQIVHLIVKQCSSSIYYFCLS